MFFSILNFDFIYLLNSREGVKEGEREGEKQCVRGTLVVALRTPPAGDLAPGMRPDWELNWQPLSSKASAQSTEAHQPGLNFKG